MPTHQMSPGAVVGCAGFVETLSDEQRAGWERAVGGLFAMAGVHPHPPRWGEWEAAWGRPGAGLVSRL